MDTVKEIRRRKGWSQKDLAEESGVGQDTISGIESGRHEPRPSTLRKLADALDVEVADFFREPAVPLDEAPETGPPQVSQEELLTQGISATAHEVEEVNYNIADLWRLVRGGKPVAYFPYEDVDQARVRMLMHLVLSTPSVITPEAADIVRQGMREKLRA